MNNKEIYAKTYAECFAECYPDLPAEKHKELIAKALGTALDHIEAVNIDGKAFKLTSARLGIKHNYKTIREYLKLGK
jgi:hypothetical protein